MKTCSLDDCGAALYAKTYCRRHYRKLHVPLPGPRKGPAPRPPIQRFWESVEKSDGCWNWVSSLDKGGYGHFNVSGKFIKAHRFAYDLLVGAIEPGMLIDHKCHNRSCVNPDHLRPATPKQNNENKRGAASNSTSGVRGVSWHKARKKWIAHTKHHSKRIYLGYFQTLEEAEAAVVAKRNELHTHNDQDRTTHGYPKDIAA